MYSIVKYSEASDIFRCSETEKCRPSDVRIKYTDTQTCSAWQGGTYSPSIPAICNSARSRLVTVACTTDRELFFARKIVVPSFYILLDLCKNNNFSVTLSMIFIQPSKVSHIKDQTGLPVLEPSLHASFSVPVTTRETTLRQLPSRRNHSFITCPLVGFSNNQSLMTHHTTSKIKRHQNIKSITSVNVFAEQAVFCWP